MPRLEHIKAEPPASVPVSGWLSVSESDCKTCLSGDPKNCIEVRTFRRNGECCKGFRELKNRHSQGFDVLGLWFRRR